MNLLICLECSCSLRALDLLANLVGIVTLKALLVSNFTCLRRLLLEVGEQAHCVAPWRQRLFLDLCFIALKVIGDIRAIFLYSLLQNALMLNEGHLTPMPMLLKSSGVSL